MAAKRILVFDADAAFAAQLQRDFARNGGVVEIVDDGNVGLERARIDRPDLILLCIELPRMNGFSICNKLKKNPELKEIPLLIMSSEATEETFEQHRKLRTRAEDYLRKPFSFEDLLDKVSRFVQLDPTDSEPEEEPVIFDEEISLEDPGSFEDRTIMAAGLGKMLSSTEPEVHIDAEVDAFTEEAFGNLMMSGGSSRVVERALQPSVRADATFPEARRLHEPTPMPMIATVPSPIVNEELRRLATENEELRRLAAENEDLRRAAAENEDLRRAAAENEDLRRPAAENEELGRAASENEDLRAQVAKLNRELKKASDDLSSAKASSGRGAGVSSRDFLDLRETINKKDKEILDLRDSVNARDKQIVDVRDKVNALEREKADLEDLQIELEKAVAEKQDQIEALTADKDAATKRGEDLKHRLERAQSEIEKAYRDIDDEKRRREEVIAAKDREMDAQAEAHSTAVDKLVAERDEREAEAVATAQAAGRNALQSALAKQASDHDAVVATIKTEHDRALEEAEERRQSELFEAEERRKTDLRMADDQRKEELRQAEARHDQATKVAAEAAAAHRERELNTQIERHGREMAVLGRKLSETEDKLQHRSEELSALRTEKEKNEARDSERIAALTKRGDELEGERDGLRVDLGTSRSDVDSLQAKVKDLSGRLAELEDKNATNEERALRALAKIRSDEQTIDKAKRAMAIALSLLDEHMQPRLEDQ